MCRLLIETKANLSPYRNVYKCKFIEIELLYTLSGRGQLISISQL